MDQQPREIPTHVALVSAFCATIWPVLTAKSRAVLLLEPRELCVVFLFLFFCLFVCFGLGFFFGGGVLLFFIIIFNDFYFHLFISIICVCSFSSPLSLSLSLSLSLPPPPPFPRLFCQPFFTVHFPVRFEETLFVSLRSPTWHTRTLSPPVSLQWL